MLEKTQTDDSIVLSKIAHIVAESPEGPRGKYPLPLEERTREPNLLLLCGKHHDIIDSKPQFYTVERLREMKEDHEALIFAATGSATASKLGREDTRASYHRETLYSTLFLVTDLPTHIYGTPCGYTEAQKEEVRSRIVRPNDETEIYPYIIQAGTLFAFQNLSYRGGPFRKLVSEKGVQCIPVREWWDDPIRAIWFASLLNRSLNKLTGRKGLDWDRDHKRYYFPLDEVGQPKEVSYRPLNQAVSTKQVVWQPISKRTGTPRPYWLHRAVSLRFHRVAPSTWCFSVRPEFRVTRDGYVPAPSEKIGSKVTRKKSRMFNYDLLGEVNFWRDFLSDGQPRIIFNFGRGQHAIVSTTMMQTEVDWPGIPEEHARPFKNVEYDEDLFSWARLAELEAHPGDASEDGEEDAEHAEEEKGADD